MGTAEIIGIVFGGIVVLFVIFCAIINEIHTRKSRWIKVEDRLPTPDEYDWVLVNVMFDEDGTYGVPQVAEYRKGEWWGYCDDVPLTELWITVTHWMPLPEYPERERK